MTTGSHRRRMSGWLVFMPILFAAGCVTAPAPRSAACPPSGSEVSFAKLVSPGFAEDYVGCTVTTVAEFLAPGMGPSVSLDAPREGRVAFRVLPPGAKGERNPLIGEVTGNFVLITKSVADRVPEFKVGDRIRLTGTNRVEVAGFLGKILGAGSYSAIVFMADSVDLLK